MLRTRFSHKFCIVLMVIMSLFASLPMVIQAQATDDTKPLQPYGEVPANPNPTPVDPATSSNQTTFAQETEGTTFTKNLPVGNPQPSERVVGNNSTLNQNLDACLNFENEDSWKGDTSRRQYAGWGMWAKDDGANYHKVNINFNDEKELYKDGKISTKISSDKPFMGQLISPQFRVSANAQITVAVSYYILANDTPSQRDDQSAWISIDVHAVPGNLAVQDSTPSNGFRKGLWVRRESTLTMGNKDGNIQIVLQANNILHSNSAIYFDNVEIWVNGKSQEDCSLESTLIGGPTPASKSNAKPKQQFLIASDTKNRTTSIQNLDVGGKIEIWSNPALDEGGKNKIGTVSSYCLRPSLPTSPLECQWVVVTVTTPQGTLTAAGTNYSKGTTTLSIIGSTGGYASIKGLVNVTPSADGIQLWYWGQ